MITNKFSIREQNEILVMTTIIHYPAISRATISQMTGLNKASTSQIVKKLVEDGLVLETGAGDTTAVGGRPPILLELNRDAGCSLSIDVGYDYLSSMLTNLNGEPLAETKETGSLVTKENILSKINNIILAHQPKFAEKTFQLIGITLAIHGIVHENQVLFTPYSNLDEMDLVAALEAEWDIPVTLENEANLSVMGEKAFTTSRKNLISVSIHSGVGAGILIDGELYRGSRGQGGEIGHMILQAKGRSCPCGNQGCMEQYCSEFVLLKEYGLLTKKKEPTLIDIFLDYQKNDSEVVSLVHKVADYLAYGLNNLIVHFDTELIILNSRIFDSLPFLIDLVKERMVSNFAKNVPLLPSTLRNQATLFGGAVTNMQNFFHIKDLNFLQMDNDILLP